MNKLLKSWQKSSHVDKCKCTKIISTVYATLSSELTGTTQERDFRVIIDSSLNLSAPSTVTVKKASKMLGIRKNVGTRQRVSFYHFIKLQCTHILVYNSNLQSQKGHSQFRKLSYKERPNSLWFGEEKMGQGVISVGGKLSQFAKPWRQQVSWTSVHQIS